MQVEVYRMSTADNGITITLESICDTFSSLIWDVEYYSCGQFEIYIAANAQNVGIFQPGKIVGRDDDKQHYGVIENVQLETNAEDGDYLTVTGRFLMSILARRIIYPTLSFTSATSYGDMVRTAVSANCLKSGSRLIPGLQLGNVSGDCWNQTATLQISYDNLMDWIYTICETVGGTANIRLAETSAGSGLYTMCFDLSVGTDRSITQDSNPHLIFSDDYSNLLSFSYAADCTVMTNFAYVFGTGEGAERTRATCYNGTEPQQLERYEVYVDAKDISAESENEDGSKTTLTGAEYGSLLRERGAENLVPVSEAIESEIVTDEKQYQYNKDYFVGDYVTVEHKRFGLRQSRIQLIGMIESFDENGRSLTPTFRTDEITLNAGTTDSSGSGSSSTGSGSSGTTTGKDGVSPVVTLERLDDGVQITVVDAEGTKTAFVADGQDGNPADLTEINNAIQQLRELAHTHVNKDILDEITAPYTAEEQEKLAGLENYTHPAYTAYDSGWYKVAVDSLGHVADAGAVTKEDITALGIPGSIPIYNVKVNARYGYSEGMPIATIVINEMASPICIPLAGEDNMSGYGLMTNAAAKKLAGIEAGANKTVVDTELDADSDNPVANRVVTAAVNNCLPLSGGTLKNNSSIAVPNSDGRSTTITSSNVRYTAPSSGGWAMGLTYLESDGTTTLSQVGAYGSGDTLNYLYFGGTYSDPLLKVDADGTVSATKFVGELSGNASTATKLQTARTINGVSFDGSSNINVPLQGCYAYDSSADWSSAPWHKVASCEAATTNYVMELYVNRSNDVTPGASGILRVFVRSGTVAGTFGYAKLTWLWAGNEINTNNFVLVYTTDTTNGKLMAELWVKLSERWEAWHFKVLSMSTTLIPATDMWTLYNSTSGESVYTEGTGVITSELAEIQNVAQAADTGWIDMEIGGYASSGTIQYRITGNQITVCGKNVVLAVDVPASQKAPQALATCEQDFSAATAYGSGVFGSIPVTVRLAVYNSINLVDIVSNGTAIPAGKKGNFTITGFID